MNGLKRIMTNTSSLLNGLTFFGGSSSPVTRVNTGCSGLDMACGESSLSNFASLLGIWTDGGTKVGYVRPRGDDVIAGADDVITARLTKDTSEDGKSGEKMEELLGEVGEIGMGDCPERKGIGGAAMREGELGVNEEGGEE